MSADSRARTRERIAAGILQEMARASCMNHIEKASSALFHMNLLWKSHDEEMRVHEGEHEGMGAPIAEANKLREPKCCLVLGGPCDDHKNCTMPMPHTHSHLRDC